MEQCLKSASQFLPLKSEISQHFYTNRATVATSNTVTKTEGR